MSFHVQSPWVQDTRLPEIAGTTELLWVIHFSSRMPSVLSLQKQLNKQSVRASAWPLALMCCAQGLFGYAVIASFPALLARCLRVAQPRHTPNCISEPPQTADQSTRSYSSKLELICSLSNALAFPQGLGEPPQHIPPTRSFSLHLWFPLSVKMKDLIQWSRHAYLNKYNRHSSYGNAIHMLFRAAGSKQSVFRCSGMTDGKWGRSASSAESGGKSLKRFQTRGRRGERDSIKFILKMDDSSKWLERPRAPPQSPIRKYMFMFNIHALPPLTLLIPHPSPIQFWNCFVMWSA